MLQHTPSEVKVITITKKYKFKNKAAVNHDRLSRPRGKQKFTSTSPKGHVCEL